MVDDITPSKDTRASTGTPTAPDFVYTIFICADIETVWNALTDADLTRRYWGHENISSWDNGAPWQHVRADDTGNIDICGRVIEMTPPTRMVWSWVSPAEADNPEKCSRVTYELIELGPDTRLTVTHTELEPDSRMNKGIRQGWPAVLSNLKTVLETGNVLREDEWPTDPDEISCSKRAGDAR